MIVLCSTTISVKSVMLQFRTACPRRRCHVLALWLCSSLFNIQDTWTVCSKFLSLHVFGQVPSLFEQEVRVRSHGSLPATGTGTVLNKCNGGSDTASVTQLKHSLFADSCSIQEVNMQCHHQKKSDSAQAAASSIFYHNTYSSVTWPERPVGYSGCAKHMVLL